MDIYLPGLPRLTDDFGASTSTAQLTVAFFLVGLGAGQLLTGPLSDIHGRRRPLLVGTGLYLVASLLCAAAPSIGLLIIARALQGAAAATGVVIARAIVRDLFSGRQAARYLSRLVLLYGLAPLLAPAIGGQLLRFTSWRGVFFLLAGAAVVLFAWTAIALPETLPPERRAAGTVRATLRTFGVLLRDRT